MGFRLVLLGLVASLGFEPPTRQGIEGWSTAGQTCLNAALDEWNAWWPAEGPVDFAEAATDRPDVAPIEVAAVPAGPTGAEAVVAARVVSDEEFAAVVEEMVAGFESAEFAAVVDQIAVDLASAPVMDEGLDEAIALEQIQDAGDRVVETSPPAQPARLATAVRLTGEALTAWANLLEGRAVASIHP